MTKQLPDLVFSKSALITLAHKAAYVPLPKEAKQLDHAEIQAYIHLKALIILLEEHGIQPQFDIDLSRSR